MNKIKKINLKIPSGVISGFLGILVFYLTIFIVVLFIVNKEVMAQTTQVATLFDTWYQVLLFVLDIIFGILLILSITSFIFKKVELRKYNGDIIKNEETTNENI